MTKRIAVPLNFTPDDMHLIQECLKAVHDNLCDDLEEDCKTFVRRRCQEVLLKVQDFIIEAAFLSQEANHVDHEGMAHDSPSTDVYCSVFGGKRKKQSLD